MPTGYTAKIAAGQTFENFVLSCARAFGACMHQRDDASTDLPRIPDDESTYHQERLAEAELLHASLESMTTEQRIADGELLRAAELESIQKRFNDKIELRDKYHAMLRRVESWSPPSATHHGLKDFMIKQIIDSVEFDCDTNYDLKALMEASAKKPLDFFNAAVAKAQWDIDYHRENADKQTNRAKENADWILQLYASIGVEYK